MSGEPENWKPSAGEVAWRILAFPITFGLLAAGLDIAAAQIFPRLQAAGALTSSAIPGVATILAASILATALLLRTGGGLSWSGLGLGRAALAPSRIVVGALLGAITIAVSSAALLASHELLVRAAAAGNWWHAALFDLELFLLAASAEELLTRGYLFALLRRKWGWKAALNVTSVVFGLLHVFNPGATPVSILAVTLAGFFLGAILLATGSLYAAIAAHVAWNWMMSALFHAAVSGEGLPSPNYSVVSNGPAWLTGGLWGPEGGAAAATAMLLVMFCLFRRKLTIPES